MISKADHIMAAVVTAEGANRRGASRGSPRGLDADAAADAQSSGLVPLRLDPGDLLSNPVPVLTLDQRAPAETHLEQILEFHITRGGNARGVALWIESNRGGGIRASRRPGAKASRKITPTRRHVLLSWPAVVSLIPGDNVRVTLRTKLASREFDWHWDSLIRKLENGRIQGIRYQQSTASPLSVLDGKRG